MSQYKPIITHLEGERVDKSNRRKPTIINTKKEIVIEIEEKVETPKVEVAVAPPKVAKLSDKVKKIKEAAEKVKRPKPKRDKRKIIELW